MADIVAGKAGVEKPAEGAQGAPGGPGVAVLGSAARGKDEINSPAHYTAGGIECIDAIKAALSAEEYRGYLKGCAMKYIWRERLKHKQGEPDLAKARWYINRLLAEGGC